MQVPDEFLDYYPEDSNQALLGMVTAMDDLVGQVVEALRSTGQEDNTIIIFTSDNGSPNKGRNGPLKGYKGTLWEGGTRVPGLIYSPLLESTPREYNGLLHVTDWHNTLLAVAGSDALTDGDGFSQWDALRTGQTPSPRDSFIYNLDLNSDKPSGAIRVGKYKFFLGANNQDPQDWLSDLEASPCCSPFKVRVRPASASLVSPLQSPYRTRVKPTMETNKVRVSGSGVSSKGIPASQPTEMLIDTTDAGPTDLNVSVTVRARQGGSFAGDVCLEQRFLCDQMEDCPDGEDEIENCGKSGVYF
ncbi:hypothetical protein O3P69_010738 [Scylla paramamosain]|uniref:Sulfatase N-terminal domain-containing protein n=1 Tax=Scylla paramamosain TaxID=85552 RepID=A0AAW0TGK7_SCYPA